jgi:arylsulfatase A-like enzyme
MMAFGPPHPPGHAPIADWSLDVPQEWLDKVETTALSFAPNVPEWILGPNRGEKGEGEEEPGARHHMQGYYASLLAMEQECGRLLDSLDQLGLAGDTIVVFVSDHGELGGAHGRYKKGTPQNESIHVPMALRWPGHLEAGRSLSFPVTLADIAPTLMGLAGLSKPPTHGLDLSRQLLHPGQAAPRKVVLIEGALSWRHPWRALRMGPWTYVEYPSNGRRLLYNENVDPWQRSNLVDDPDHAAALPELKARLRSLVDWINDE